MVSTSSDAHASVFPAILNEAGTRQDADPVTRTEFRAVVAAVSKLEDRLNEIVAGGRSHTQVDRVPDVMPDGAPILIINVPQALIGVAVIVAILTKCWNGLKLLLSLLWPLQYLVKIMDILESLVEVRRHSNDTP